MKILLIEDVHDLARPLTRYLSLEGITVVWRETIADARYLLSCERVDAIVLDLGLPDGDGRALTRDLRRDGVLTPIIILTSRGMLETKVDLLSSGADDYLVKPVDPRELIARLEAILRREMSHKSQEIIQGDIRLDMASQSLWYYGNPVDLSPRELSVMILLMQHAGQIFSRDEIFERIWGEDPSVHDSKVVDVYIGYLRKKLSREAIQNKKGFGYYVEG